MHFTTTISLPLILLLSVSTRGALAAPVPNPGPQTSTPGTGGTSTPGGGDQTAECLQAGRNTTYYLSLLHGHHWPNAYEAYLHNMAAQWAAIADEICG